MGPDGRAFLPACHIKKSGHSLDIAVAGLCHGHVWALARGLVDAGARIVLAWDEDPVKLETFLAAFPQARKASYQEILDDKDIKLVINCTRPDRRAGVSVEILKAGKNVFSDKPGFLTREQASDIKAQMLASKLHYYIYFSESFHSEGSVFAQSLIDSGKLGSLVHFSAASPHRLNPETRPSWFFDSRINGSILVDLGCHLVQQFLCFTHSPCARVLYARLANREHPEHPGFFDFGEAVLEGSDGVTGYIEVDWFTPDGLGTWGDCRTFVRGTKASLEIRKYTDIARENEADHVYLVDSQKEMMFRAEQELPFFAKMIDDILNDSDEATGRFDCLDAMSLAVEVSEKAMAEAQRGR